MVQKLPETGDLLDRVMAGDRTAAAELFTLYRVRLRQMVRLRLDQRLQGRLDPSDVLQESFLDVSRRLDEYVANPAMPFYLWVRLITGQRLVALHRMHIGAQKRDAGQEISLHRGALPQASSMSLAQQLLGRLTSPPEAAIRAELQIRLQEAINSLDPIDREILALRHFEELTNNEAAIILGLKKAAASHRYMRALNRLTEIVAAIPGLREE